MTADAQPPRWSAEMVDAVIAAIRTRRAAIDSGHTARYPYEMLDARYVQTDVLALMEDLEDADITESGVSTRTGWVRDYDPTVPARIEAFKASRTYDGELAE